MPVYDGPWADERQVGQPITDCVVATMLNGENVESDGAKPVTDAEVDALRAASGDTQGGETLAAGDLALRRRYGRRPHTVADTRARIEAALDEGAYIAVIGLIGALPARLRTQSRSVMHAVLMGPGKIIDPLDRSGPGGKPQARSISRSEQLDFARSGGYEALVFIPHVYRPKHWEVHLRAGLFFVYREPTPAKPKWSRGPHVTGGTTYRCAAPQWVDGVMGKRRKLVEVLEGKFKGRYIDVGYTSRIVAREVS